LVFLDCGFSLAGNKKSVNILTNIPFCAKLVNRRNISAELKLAKFFKINLIGRKKMDRAIMEFLEDDFEKLISDKRRATLIILRDKPEIIVKNISRIIHNLAINLSMCDGSSIMVNEGDAEAFVSYMKEKHKEEIAAL